MNANTKTADTAPAPAGSTPYQQAEQSYARWLQKPCECDACGWTGKVCDMPAGLDGIEDLTDRIDPGSIVPVGECPECGALAYLVEKEETELLQAQLKTALEALKAIVQTCQAGVIQRNETGKPTWSALPHMEAIARAAIAQVEGREP